MRMVSAYAIMANGGRHIEPSLDRPYPGPLRQDRLQARPAALPTAAIRTGGMGADIAELVDEREQVLDPMTAYRSPP